MVIKNELLKKAYDGSYYTIIGAGGDLEEWKTGYADMLSEKNIGSVKEWIVFKGADMNEEFGLTGKNKYDAELTFWHFRSMRWMLGNSPFSNCKWATAGSMMWWIMTFPESCLG